MQFDQIENQTEYRVQSEEQAFHFTQMNLIKGT